MLAARKASRRRSWGKVLPSHNPTTASVPILVLTATGWLAFGLTRRAGGV